MKSAMLHSKAGPPPTDEDELSEYTDADESISAPTEFLAEFLSAIMGKDYPTALKYCKLILQYEPNNRTAREFYPLLEGKLIREEKFLLATNSEKSAGVDGDKTDSEEESSSGGSGSGSLTGSESDEDCDDSDSELSEEEEDDDDEEGDGNLKPAIRRNEQQQPNDNSSVEFGDTDGTTASYSSLEDEEADPPGEPTSNFISAPLNDNEDAGNGNEVCSADSAALPFSGRVIPTTQLLSDSESPTEPVSQQLIGELRSRVVHRMSSPTPVPRIR